MTKRVLASVAMTILVGVLVFAVHGDNFSFLGTMGFSKIQISNADSEELEGKTAYCTSRDPDSVLSTMSRELLTNGWTKAADINDKRGTEVTFTRRSGEFLLLLSGTHKVGGDRISCRSEVIMETYRSNLSCGNLH